MDIGRAGMEMVYFQMHWRANDFQRFSKSHSWQKVASVFLFFCCWFIIEAIPLWSSTWKIMYTYFFLDVNIGAPKWTSLSYTIHDFQVYQRVDTMTPEEAKSLGLVRSGAFVVRCGRLAATFTADLWYGKVAGCWGVMSWEVCFWWGMPFSFLKFSNHLFRCSECPALPPQTHWGRLISRYNLYLYWNLSLAERSPLAFPEWFKICGGTTGHWALVVLKFQVINGVELVMFHPLVLSARFSARPSKFVALGVLPTSKNNWFFVLGY